MKDSKMTTKELASAAGVSRQTINRTAKKLFPCEVAKGKKAFFTKEQSFDIMQRVRKKNMVQIQPVQTEHQPVQTVEVIAQAVAIAMQSVMMPMF